MSTSYMYPEMQAFDLREEFDRVLDGWFDEPGIGRPLVIRRITDTPCACFRKSTGSPDPNCKYCQGEGYLWSETLHVGYIARNFGSVLGSSSPIAAQTALGSFGMTDNQRAVAYMKSTSFPDYERYTIPTRDVPDKLYEMKVNDDGSLYHPLVKTAKWKISSCTPHHGNSGKIEYFELGLDKINV